jgi:hydrogenase maturation protease
METVGRIIVLGIGNPLCRDDGIGIRVVGEMRDSGKYSGIDILDGGASPDLFSLLDPDVSKLIIVDALRGGGRPGAIYRLKLGGENIADETPASLHGMGILDSLKLMKQLGRYLPAVIIIGIEPADVSHGLRLSPAIEALVPDLIKAVEEELCS